MEEMEGAGQPQRKGAKEATIHCGRWEDEKTDPEVLQPGVGVLRSQGSHPSPGKCPLWLGAWPPPLSAILLGSPAPTPLLYTALYLLHESKLFSPAGNLAPTPWEKWCVALCWTLYFISANKSHFILYLGKAGWQQPKNVKKNFFCPAPRIYLFSDLQ